jgi:hypothetical protein
MRLSTVDVMGDVLVHLMCYGTRASYILTWA